MTRHALVVCTANVCRSPSVERLLQRRLDCLVDVDGETWTVSSAGTAMVRADMDQYTLDAAADVGVNLADHVRRHLDSEILAAHGADLVLAMTREHLRAVIGVDPGAWPRTFTLKELVRRAGRVAPASAAEGVRGWLARVGNGRRAAAMIMPDPLDDIADPYGGPRREHVAMIAETSELVDRLVRLGPWTTSSDRVS